MFVVRTVPSFEWRRVLYVQLYEWLYVEKKNSWSKKNHENPISSEREVSRVSRWQSFPKMYFTLPVKKKRKKKKEEKKQEKETEERKIFLLSANFRSRVSLSDFIVVFSKLHLAKTEFHMKFPESNKGRSTIQRGSNVSRENLRH